MRSHLGRKGRGYLADLPRRSRETMGQIYRLRLMNQISFLRLTTPGFSYTATM